MLKEDLVIKSPVEKTIGSHHINDVRFGAILSRAGVGKTSFLIQVGLTQLLKNQKILHVSLHDTIEKITLRYAEGYNNLVDSIGYVDPQKAKQLWDNYIAPNKMCISYNDTIFNTAKIKDYLENLQKAALPLPGIMVLDGLDFDKDNSNILEELKEIHKKFSIAIWFAIRSHKEESKNNPNQLMNYNQLFDKMLFLMPVNNRIKAIILLKDGTRIDTQYMLNPSTMMVVNDQE